MVTCSKLPSEDGSVISNESEKLKSGRGLTALKVTAQQKLTKEETRKKEGESHTHGCNNVFYSSLAHKVRCVTNGRDLFPFSPVWTTVSSTFLPCAQVTQRCALPPQYSQKGSHSAVGRDGPDEYAWDRHSADMIQYVNVVDAVTDWHEHTHAHIH